MLVAIDAGHGSNTAGKRTPDGYKEHYANVKCAYFFSLALERCGIQYIKTGWDDTDATDDPDVALSKRQKAIKDAGADYSVSWHFNAFGNGSSYNSAQGIETLISDKDSCVGDSKKLAECIQEQLIQGTPQNNRAVKRQALSMCNCYVMETKASVLIECGFMTNEYEAKLMKSDAFCKECAEEAAKGLCKYAKVQYVPEQAKPTSVDKSFKVKITDKDHKIRLGPGMSYPIVGVINDNGVYTIVEQKGNWGRLKSGAGWTSIHPKYAQRL